MVDLIIVGGGLAGCEAAWQAAVAGLKVQLFEMRPGKTTGAHQTSNLAELVCSNSLGSNLSDRASGVLKNELRRLGSMLLECAEKSALPAGGALAVDRQAFSDLVTERITSHPSIQLVREEVEEVPSGPAIIASGPLTSPALSESLARANGQEHLFFFDAIAPIVSAESIDMDRAFRASRYGAPGDEEGDYINCPLNKQEYYKFVDALQYAERIDLRSFEEAIRGGVKAGHFFEGCLPVEVISERGPDSLAFGPMRPVGLVDPRTGHRPWAVVQLRQDTWWGSKRTSNIRSRNGSFA
jgi:methylenetetrahydrofolate--tRNA-(uracil-5-)-methyltransferase